MSRPPGPWLAGPAFDLPLVLLPGLLCALAAPLLPPGAGLSPAAFFALVVLLDVGHVWATLWRLWTDRGPGARWRALGLPLAVAAALVALALGAIWVEQPGLYWRVLAYVAVFHFIRQQVGVAMLYRQAAGLPPGPAAAAERRAHWALAGLPVLWWHAHLPRPFSWFAPDDFIPGLPPAALIPAGGAAAAALADHARRRWAEGGGPSGRDLWLLNTAAVWGLGIIVAEGDLAFTLPNVVHHAAPYLALVALVEVRRARAGLPGALPRALTVGVGPLLLALGPMALAVGEEALWDRLVWQEHPGLFGGADPWAALEGLVGVGRWLTQEDGESAPTDAALAVATALLTVPQAAHYLLDGLIWRSGKDPALRALLSPDPR